MKYIVYILLALSLLINAGCSDQDSTKEHELFISAASSLSNVLSKLAEAFESEHPNTKLTLNYGASGKLAQQIQQGAPVDLFLSADQKWMDNLAEQKMILDDTRINFTQNKLVLVSTNNANLSIDSLKDLPSSGLDQIAIGNPESVPAGSYAKEALTASGTWKSIKSQLVHAKDARQVLTYVESGNTDIGFVYASDLNRSKMVTEVTKIDESLYKRIDYPAAVMTSSDTMEKAKAFIDFLQTDEAQSILAEYGFNS
ncbi:molybdate transport system substrate-binding protein [Virgibacillus subterraneus]|uniref:Molybdate transport system substrate-binding protein n=1 Tax=Virgibacillus subterraneus TaxID=621109 RepID=A0A1H8Z3V7_9BACI|nr:molybdate ABC transporter substrate-binding protein [Virgibacillus subterraneus]SEP59011.1 molybdate transport system substrate-binding protein [Virgibacillus subterraneus]